MSARSRDGEGGPRAKKQPSCAAPLAISPRVISSPYSSVFDGRACSWTPSVAPTCSRTSLGTPAPASSPALTTSSDRRRRVHEQRWLVIMAPLPSPYRPECDECSSRLPAAPQSGRKTEQPCVTNLGIDIFLEGVEEKVVKPAGRPNENDQQHTRPEGGSFHQEQ